jgi:phenylacetate-CoA ligase
MSDYYDALETRDAAQREAEQFELLREQLRYAKREVPAYAALLGEVNPDAVRARDALAELPVTRKSELAQAQAGSPPLGGYCALSGRTLPRVFSSPGGIFEPQGTGGDFWRTARALYAAGCREGDLLHNTFSYHFTPAGFMLEGGAHALGCTVFPDKAHEMGVSLSPLTIGLVSGEALPTSLREELATKGVNVLQAYATADVGLIGYESPAREGLILDEQVLVEIVRPGTGDPVSPGEVGEVLVTTLQVGYPLIRFATGDLSAFMDGVSACGRTNQRVKGWMGRADQTAKVRGMFVHPSQVAQVVSRHQEITRARLVIERVDNSDKMTLRCELTGGAERSPELTDDIAISIREVCKLRGEVELFLQGALPNDGKVIDDLRPLD